MYYFSCTAKPEQLDWHETLPNVAVTYINGLPNTQFFGTVKPNSIVIIDDQFEDAIESPVISRAFKVDSRHQKFSIVLITQVKI